MSSFEAEAAAAAGEHEERMSQLRSTLERLRQTPTISFDGLHRHQPLPPAESTRSPHRRGPSAGKHDDGTRGTTPSGSEAAAMSGSVTSAQMTPRAGAGTGRSENREHRDASETVTVRAVAVTERGRPSSPRLPIATPGMSAVRGRSKTPTMSTTPRRGARTPKRFDPDCTQLCGRYFRLSEEALAMSDDHQRRLSPRPSFYTQEFARDARGGVPDQEIDVTRMERRRPTPQQTRRHNAAVRDAMPGDVVLRKEIAALAEKREALEKLRQTHADDVKAMQRRYDAVLRREQDVLCREHELRRREEALAAREQQLNAAAEKLRHSQHLNHVAMSMAQRTKDASLTQLKQHYEAELAQVGRQQEALSRMAEGMYADVAAESSRLSRVAQSLNTSSAINTSDVRHGGLDLSDIAAGGVDGPEGQEADTTSSSNKPLWDRSSRMDSPRRHTPVSERLAQGGGSTPAAAKDESLTTHREQQQQFAGHAKAQQGAPISYNRPLYDALPTMTTARPLPSSTHHLTQHTPPAAPAPPVDLAASYASFDMSLSARAAGLSGGTGPDSAATVTGGADGRDYLGFAEEEDEIDRLIRTLEDETAQHQPIRHPTRSAPRVSGSR